MGVEARSVVVRLTAETAQYIAQMQAAGRMTENAMRPAQAATMRQSQAIDTLGRTAGTVGLAAAGALGLAAKAAMDWETQWAGVAKTVDGTDQQLSALEDDLRGLARTMPATHEEIAATAEAAGQLGVATGDITDFTKVMVEMGETTNLTADEAATSIAQLMNVMQTAADDVDEIGNTIVDLGNKGASTEAQITDMAQRVAGAGTTIGATEQDVLGLSAAMANLGIQSELGGGAMQRVLVGINTSVLSGSDVLVQYAEVAGTSAQEFAEAWSTDPVRAFDQLVQGLGRIQAEGGDVASVLSDMGIKGTQNLQVMLRLAGAGDMLTQSLDQSAVAWEQNDALLIEYTKRAATTASQAQVAWNSIKDAGIDAGESLLPVVSAAAHSLTGLASAYRALPGPAQGAINGLLGTTAVLGLGVWGAAKAVGTIRDIRGALDALPGPAGRAAGALKAVGVAAAAYVALEAFGGAMEKVQDSVDESLPGLDAMALKILQLKDGQISSLGVEFDSLGSSIERVTNTGLSDKWLSTFKVLPGLGDIDFQSMREANAEIELIDQTLTSLVQSGGPEVAADGLAAIAKSAGLTRGQMLALEPLLTGYQEAVAGAAAQDLIAADAAGEHGAGVRSGADALEFFLGPADAAASSAEHLGKQMAITTMDAKAFKAEFDAINGALDVSGSMVAYERAIDALSESMGSNGSFNAGIEAGRTNIENLNSVVSTAIQRSQALKDTGDDLGALRVLKRAIGDLEEFGSKSEGAKRQAQPLIDELKSTRDNLRMDLNPKPAMDAIDEVGGALDDLQGRRTRPRIDADGKPARGEINSTEQLLQDLVGTPYTAHVTADTSAARAAIAALRSSFTSISGSIRSGLGGGFDRGGYTGPGAKMDVAGLVHRGEFVFSADATSGNELMLDSLHKQLRGYDQGGLVGLPGYAGGGPVRSLDDRLEIAQLLQQIRDMQRDLAATIKKGPNKGEHQVRGLDRELLELQLEAARRDLQRAKHADEIQARQEAREKAREARQEAREQRQQRADLTAGIGSLFDSIFPPAEQTKLQQVSAAIADFKDQWLAAGGEWTNDMREWARDARQAAAQYDANAAVIEAETAQRDRLAQTLTEQQSQLEALNSTMESVSSSIAGNFTGSPFTRTSLDRPNPAATALEQQLAAAQAAGDAAAASRLMQQIALAQSGEATGLDALRASVEGDIADAEAFTAALAELASKGLDTTGEFGVLYAQLSASGDVVTAEQLAALNADQIDEYEKLFATREDRAATAGALATQAMYGEQHAQLVAVVDQSTAAIQALDATVAVLEATQAVLGEQVRAGAEAGSALLGPQLAAIKTSVDALPRELAQRLRGQGGR